MVAEHHNNTKSITPVASELTPPALTLVAASIFDDLGGRRLFEDAGFVELQLFDALFDVAQGSERENMVLLLLLLRPGVHL